MILPPLVFPDLMHEYDAATSRVENSAQVKFVHDSRDCGCTYLVFLQRCDKKSEECREIRKCKWSLTNSFPL